MTASTLYIGTTTASSTDTAPVSAPFSRLCAIGMPIMAKLER